MKVYLVCGVAFTFLPLPTGDSTQGDEQFMRSLFATLLVDDFTRLVVGTLGP